MRAEEARANLNFEAVMEEIYSQIELTSKSRNETYVWYVPKPLMREVCQQLKRDGYRVKNKRFSVMNEFYIHW